MDRKKVYDVALWLTYPRLGVFPVYVEEVEAKRPYEAACLLMAKHGLVSVPYASLRVVGMPGIARFPQGVQCQAEAGFRG